MIAGIGMIAGLFLLIATFGGWREATTMLPHMIVGATVGYAIASGWFSVPEGIVIILGFNVVSAIIRFHEQTH